MEDDRFGNMGVSLLIAASLGVVMALLFAPCSGEETRARIRNRYDDLTERIKEMVCKEEEDTTEELAERMAERLS